MTKTQTTSRKARGRQEFERAWVTSRVSGALDGLEIARSSVGELRFEALRAGSTVSSWHATLTEIEREIAALASRLRQLCPDAAQEGR